jgi:hypothetical protein
LNSKKNDEKVSIEAFKNFSEIDWFIEQTSAYNNRENRRLGENLSKEENILLQLKSIQSKGFDKFASFASVRSISRYISKIENNKEEDE